MKLYKIIPAILLCCCDSQNAEESPSTTPRTDEPHESTEQTEKVEDLAVLLTGSWHGKGKKHLAYITFSDDHNLVYNSPGLAPAPGTWKERPKDKRILITYFFNNEDHELILDYSRIEENMLIKRTVAPTLDGGGVVHEYPFIKIKG